MNGGTISLNTADGDGGDGGGVEIDNGGLFNMTGGAINNNSASGTGGGVFSYNGTFAITTPASLSSIDAFNSAGVNGNKVYKHINGVFTIDGILATGGTGGSTTGASGTPVYWD
jgi:hypothetical protein